MKPEYTPDSNIIFLDFDGVLTSIEAGNSFMLMDDKKYKPSPKLLKRLVNLCDETNAKIVIASNWRNYPEDAYLSHHGIIFFNQIPALRKKLRKYIIGDLPSDKIHIPGKRKADYLLEWFDQHKDFKGKFVIFDDADYEKYGETRKKRISSHFIRTDYKIGLSEENVQKAKKLLT